MKQIAKLMLAGVVALGASVAAQAEDYNRVTLSYNNVHYGYNSVFGEGYKDNSFSTNGIGVGYQHGFAVSKSLPMFVELGANIDFNFYGKSESEKDGSETFKVSAKFQNINLNIPVNYVYKFAINDDFSVAPYIGINFKLNFVSRANDTVEYTDTEYPEANFKKTSDWINYYSSDEKNMGSKDDTWNRFQMGWQIGVGVQYKPYYLALQYGTDFIGAYSYKFDLGETTKTARISNGTFKLVLGYHF